MLAIIRKNLKDKDAGEKICKELVNAASTRWNKECIFYRDDISCIVVIFSKQL